MEDTHTDRRDTDASWAAGVLTPDIAASIRRALEEDIGPGDATTDSIIPAEADMRGQIIAKQAGVVAGLDVAQARFPAAGRARAASAPQVAEGARGENRQVLADGVRPGARLLTAERTALNFLGRMSGIATLTRQFVDAVAGTRAVILDTRKTAPGLRAVDKLAVRARRRAEPPHRPVRHDPDQGQPHRLCRLAGRSRAARARRRRPGWRSRSRRARWTTCRTALDLGVERILLDNMTLEMMRAGRAR